VYSRFNQWPVSGTIKASNAGAFGKKFFEAAGIEARTGFPVAKQSPPQYGISRSGAKVLA
jgi:hypothetical protein